MQYLVLVLSRGNIMSASKPFPYVINMDALYKPLEIVEEKAVADANTHKWVNQTLCEVNDSLVRVAVIEGEYHWHKHDDDDEFFYVVGGQAVDRHSKGRTIELAPRQGVVIPREMMHRPRAPQRTVMLMVETGGIVPTGS